MTRLLKVNRVGPGVTVQDRGRTGWLHAGLSRGGAADRLALAEGAALLGQSDLSAAIEMAGVGGEFEATQNMRIALSGAPMRATLDGANLAWNTSHLLPAGARLKLGSTLAGTYGYLTLGGGIRAQQRLGAGSAHLAAGVGTVLAAGEVLEIGPDRGTTVGMTLDVEDRCAGGSFRMVESFQSHLFAPEARARFQDTEFQRDARGNRMGVRLQAEGAGFHIESGRNVLSEVIVPGDIQITGDGTPFVLMSECQTTGGYPRIGTVLPCDLPRLAQAAPGARLRFTFVDLEVAVALQRAEAGRLARLAQSVRPLIRDPRMMTDLLSYQLIGGAIVDSED